MKLNLALLWTVLSATLASSLWIFNNIAWASDIEKIEIRLIKQDIREIRREISMLGEDEATLEYLEEELEILIDELCAVKPDDRECK
jgi:hypothetical protein